MYREDIKVLRDFVTKYIDHNVVKRFLCENCTTLIFLFFLFFYLSFGLYITYFNPTVTNVLGNLIYDTDTGKHYIWYYLGIKFPTLKHPLSAILIYPLSSTLGYIFSPKLAIIIIQSLIQSISTYLIYRILYVVTQNHNLSVLICIVFGFSYTVAIMAILPEIYVWAGLTQILLLYYIVTLITQKTTNLNFKNILIIAILTLFCFSINIVNIVSSILLLIHLLISVYKTSIKNIFIKFCQIIVIVFLLTGLAIHFQDTTLPHDPQGKGNVIFTNNISIKNIKEMTIGTFIEPFYALKSAKAKYYSRSSKLKNGKIKQCNIKRFLRYKKQPPIRYIPAIVFLLMSIILYIYNLNGKPRFILCTLAIIILAYAYFNTIFFSNECALFAMNYFPFLIILLGLLYEKVPNLYRNIIVGGFLCYIIPQNIHYLFKIQRFVHSPADKFHSYGECMLYALLFTVIVGASIYVCKKIMDKYKCCTLSVEENYFVYTLLYLGFILVFGVFHAFSIYKV